jgi:hypothetical protein
MADVTKTRRAEGALRSRKRKASVALAALMTLAARLSRGVSRLGCFSL